MSREFHSATFSQGEKVAGRPQEHAGEMRGGIWGRVLATRYPSPSRVPTSLLLEFIVTVPGKVNTMARFYLAQA